MSDDDRTIGECILFGMWPAALALVVIIAGIVMMVLVAGRAHADAIDPSTSRALREIGVFAMNIGTIAVLWALLWVLWDRRSSGPMWLLVIGFALIGSGAAFGHDHNHPELTPWFKSLESRAKSPCCDGSDATSLDDPDWESKDGHYRVKLDGEWVDVPDSAVVEGPNRAGPAMVWPYYLNGGMRGVRCFMPGSMT